MTLRLVFILVQLNKCVVCGSVLQMGHSGDGCKNFHQTAFFHLSTHFLAFSLNFRNSSKVQA